MNISAIIRSSQNQHEINLQTNGSSKAIIIPPKSTGYGSSVNGGELLMLALATCFCNDLYREAAKRNIAIDSVEVECTGDFGAEGEPGSNFQYTAHVSSASSQEEINELIKHTDTVAEIHNTLRKGLSIKLNT
ncbi:MAG TPA: OsmC family protein [Cyclobacteriaceae bacterium]|jgi:uncharacterized OsmC-like protein|nr:OsmC family protein [Cyclobacteriaceae bacterium]